MKVLPLLLAALVATAAAAERPNFLLIIADDLNWRDLGFTGNPDVKTPHLDALRREGMQLNAMFTPATTCSPTRHALYTGLHSVRSGAYPNHTRVQPGTKSVFTHLAAAGYRVALHGKEHVSPKESFPYEHLGQRGEDDFAPARAFVTRSAAQPWLLVFASNDPHSPWTRGPADLHDPATIKVPSYLHDNAVTRDLLARYYREIHQLDRQVGELLRLLTETGQAANTLVMFLSEQGSSFPYGGKWSVYDNGIRAAALVRWPGRVHAGSSSNALLQYTDVPLTFLAAAGLDPAQLDPGCPDAHGQRGFDGRSFLDVLTGKTDRFHDVVFAQHTTVGINGYQQPYPIRAARDARYKYIRNLTPENRYDIGGIHRTEPLESWKVDAKSNPALAARIEWLYRRPGEELYDLQTDPEESRNLAADPALAATKKRLAGALDAWMAQQGDKGLETELLAPTRQAAERAEKSGAGKAKKKKQP